MPIDPVTGSALISAGASAIGGLLGFGSSKSAAKDTYKYNSKLMAQQQEYARENSATQYARQRELTADSWMLNKEGMRNAGINPAFLDGSQNATANTEQAAAPSNPSMNVQPYDVGSLLSNAGNSISNIILQSPDIRKKAAEADIEESNARWIEARNAYEISKLSGDADKAKADAKKASGEAQVEQNTRENRIQMVELEKQSKELEVEMQQTQNEIAKVTKSMNEEQLKQLQFITEHQAEKWMLDVREQNSRIKANDASAAASYSSAAASHADSLYKSVLTKFEQAKLPYANQLAQYVRDQAYNTERISYYNKLRSSMEYRNDKEWHTSESSSYAFGEWMRNAIQGWVPFSGSVSAAKVVK